MALFEQIPAPRRVLIIKPSAIGDVVHALPVLPRLRKLWPSASITWMATPPCAALVQNHPLIDDVIIFQRKRFGRVFYNPGAMLELVGLVRQLRRRRFDLVIDLQGLFRSAWVARATGAPHRIGFAGAREGAPVFYTRLVECSQENDHAVERYLKVASALGCDGGPIEFTFAVDDADRQFAAALVPAGSRYAVFLPGANWGTKRWPVEKFAGLVEPLKKQFGLDVVVAGARADSILAQQIPGTINLTGKTNLRQMVALLERAELVVANDTGPMHMAAALKRPLVAPYGPTSPRRTGPFGRMDSVIRLDIPCSPCFSRTCSHQSCLQWLDVEPVLKLAKLQMEKGALESANHATRLT
ncbi:MAG: lipopolysaccharide heptosyltransferase I [Planctomycetota bacterium]|nr:lipopolysaccharide heptosyltransferase I [Planctomycetota bacterium]